MPDNMLKNTYMFVNKLTFLNKLLLAYIIYLKTLQNSWFDSFFSVICI